MPSTIIFSCDEKFMPLAKGLVLSLKQFGVPNQELHMNFIDIGCGAESLDWLRAHGIRIHSFSYLDHYRFDADVTVERYHQALLCRPVLPQIVPGYDAYVFIDCDIWIQEGFVLDHYLGLAKKYTDKVIISPALDYSYIHAYARSQDFFNACYRIFNRAYGDEVAREYAFRPIFNCGFFAMAASCPIWSMWKKELDVVFNRNYHGYDKHGVEQLAMNYLIYKTGNFIPMEAIFNYHCHEGYARRDPSTGKVIVGYPPNRVIGALHLTATSHFIKKYMDLGLLFDHGRYLTESERQGLLSLNHYF